jgi:hypothetical protein
VDIAAFDIPAEAQSWLAGQFSEATRLQALTAALAEPVKDIDDIAVALQTWRDIDTATGVALDQIGQIINQPRYGGGYPVGEADADYRPKLRAAILRNRSNGTAEQLIAMVVALLDGLSPVVQVADVYPAGFVLAVWVSAAPSTAQAQALVDFCVAAKAAGVGIVGLAWYTAPTFAFDGFPDPPFKGYDDGTGLVGGYWANYIYP